MDNIQKSEFVIAKILGLLMEWGIDNTLLIFGELELDDEFESFFIPCINWLSAEGVIRTGRISEYDRSGEVSRPVLSSYGMQILGLEITLDGHDMTLAKAVREVQSGERSYSQLGDFFGGLLGGFSKTLGS